jgi:4-amino-4-deoxy-L-arabinose transferase-like glycosyltransferase
MDDVVKKRPYPILVLLLLLAFALRIYRLPQLSLRADEATTVFEASVEWNELLRSLGKPGPHQPLYLLLLHGWMRLAGNGELAVRYLTLICGVLLLPLVYVLGRRLFPDEPPMVALWACLLVAINPLLIWDAQDNRMYPLLAVFNAASFYWSLSALQHRGGWMCWLGYVASTTLALYTHYLAVFLVLTENVVWAVLIWSRPRRWQRIGRWVTAQAAVALLFAPWMLRTATTVSQYSTDFLPLVQGGEMLQRTLVGLSLGRSVGITTGTFLGAGFLVVLALGLWLPAGRWRTTQPDDRFTQGSSLLVLLVYLVVPILAIAAFSILRFPIFDERYIMLSLPAYLLILGRGLSNLSAPASRRWVAALGLIWVLVASGFSLRNYYYIPRHMKGIDWRSYVARLLELAEPGDVLVQNYPDPGLTYHLRDRMPRVLLPAAHPVDVQGTVDELRRLSETHSRMWLQPQRYALWDAEGLVEEWMDRYTFKVAEERFGNARLSLYLPPQTYEQVLSPVDAVFQDRIRLVGYVLEAEPRGLSASPQPPDSVSLQPGGRLYLALFWHSLAEIPGDYTVFTHLYDQSERLWGQKDGPPIGGSYPTSQWQLGEMLVDKYEIVLDPQAPAGEYRLAVGMYIPAIGERLSVIGDEGILMGADRVLVARVWVEK